MSYLETKTCLSAELYLSTAHHLVVLLNIFVETVMRLIFFRIYRSSKEQRLFEIKIFCNIINVFTVTFDHFIASLMNKSIVCLFKSHFPQTSIHLRILKKNCNHNLHKNVCLITKKNYILKYIQIESSYFKWKYYFTILLYFF